MGGRCRKLRDSVRVIVESVLARTIKKVFLHLANR